MKIRLYLLPSAHARVAKNDHVYGWDISVQAPRTDGTWMELDPGYTYLTELEVELPPPEDAVLTALDYLRKQESKIQAEAYQAVLEVQEERSKLLSLTYNDIPTTEFSDVPF